MDKTINTPAAYTKLNQFIQTAEQIGSFSAYVRRPVPNLSGMLAQFFGPNGEDSDSILALSLTKYLDAEVFVSVYMIKDANGMVMKEPSGSYPKIAEFLSIIRRGLPNKGGMLAQFFATNGEDSDAINELGKSKYQDCLVYIDIRGKYAKTQKEEITDPSTIIEQEYANRVSQHEIKEYQKKEKQFKKLNQDLSVKGFLRHHEVLYALGTHNDYIDWLTTQGCCWHNTCTNDPVIPFEIKSIAPYFNYLVFCEEHLDLIKENVEILPGGETFLQMKQMIQIQTWAMSVLRQRFSITGKQEPDSAKIAAWARENKIDKYLPQSFKNLV